MVATAHVAKKIAVLHSNLYLHRLFGTWASHLTATVLSRDMKAQMWKLPHFLSKRVLNQSKQTCSFNLHCMTETRKSMYVYARCLNPQNTKTSCGKCCFQVASFFHTTVSISTSSLEPRQSATELGTAFMNVWSIKILPWIKCSFSMQRPLADTLWLTAVLIMIRR